MGNPWPIISAPYLPTVPSPLIPQGDGKPPGAGEAAARPPPRRIDRVFKIDGRPVNLTGFYEHQPNLPDENAGFSLQLNQVGMVLIGWFSEPHRVVPNPSRVKTLTQVKPNERAGVGAFMADLSYARRDSDRNYLIPFMYEWAASAPDVINEHDPSTGMGTSTGTLRLTAEQSPEVAIGTTKRSGEATIRDWLVSGINFSRTPDRFDLVWRVSSRPRLPYHLIRQQGELLRDALVGSHVCVLPQSYIQWLLRRVTAVQEWGLFGKEKTTPPGTQTNIDAWKKADSGAAKKVARQQVLSSLASFHTDVSRLPYLWHREQVRDAFIGHSQSATTMVGLEPLSYHRIYLQMMAEETADDSTAEQTLLAPIVALGTFPAFTNKTKRFRYTLSFEPLPFVGDLLKTKVGPVGFGAGVYTVDATCETVEFETEADGTVKIETVSGNPKVKSVLSTRDLTKGIGVEAKYAAYAAGVGLGSASGPVKVGIITPIPDLAYTDFEGAFFDFVSVAAKSPVSMGNLLSIEGITSSFFHIQLPKRTNLELWGSVTEIPTYPVTSPALSQLKGASEAASDPLKAAGKIKEVRTAVKEKGGVHPAAEGWLQSFKLSSLKFDPSGVFGLSVGYGYIGTSDAVREKVTRLNAPQAQPLVIRDVQYLGRSTIEEFFRRDDASIDLVVQSVKSNLTTGIWTKRLSLEVYLCEALYLLLHSDTKLSFTGYASPEGPAGPLPDGQNDPYNVELSRARNETVYAAVLDAMSIWADRWTRLVDFFEEGEIPARKRISEGGGGLIDPPSTQNAAVFNAWCRAHENEVRKWPEWRKVELSIGGFSNLSMLD